MVNCKKCGVDFTTLKQYETELGLLCEHCYNKYILGKSKTKTDSWTGGKKPKLSQKTIGHRILLHLFVAFFIIVTMPFVMSVNFTVGTIHCILGTINGICVLYYTFKLEVKNDKRR